MVDKQILFDNLENTLLETDFPSLGEKYKGKVRDNYINKDKGQRTIIASDRLSAFDRVITTIPFKGQLLSQLSNFWFEQTKNMVPNHILDIPDPNVCIVKECKSFPIEMVIRGYITGSAWRDYEKGELISGIKLPDGMKKHQKLDSPIITPSTKAEAGEHDEHISREYILDNKLVEKDVYEQVEEFTFKLFEFGQKFCAKNNLILVDCKYEFGITNDNEIIVIDEIHTPDASRYWILDTYEGKYSKGEEPDILDKEFFRQWLINEHNYMGDGLIPNIPGEIRVELATRYIESYETITGKKFNPNQGNIIDRIKSNLNI
ncbi:MAG: phosphoribosylaminoimidazolesuccinocarboxamide synthase [archaeon]|nr:phosphoribosylaminoimidazolesuccinocarboxamide synthase [archaeon]